MNINVNNQNAAQIVIDIEGVIGLEESIQFQTETSAVRVSTFEKFKAEIEKIDTNVVQSLRLNIRSMGGAVQDALLMHSLIAEIAQKIEVETHCYGFSASAATIIAQAASPDKRYVAGSALYMVHKASMQFDGNQQAAESAAELLAKTDEQIALIYAMRSGLLPEHFLELMSRDNGNGEWLTAQEAVEMGLADHVESIISIKKVVNSITNFFKKIFAPQPASALQNAVLEEEVSMAPQTPETQQSECLQTEEKDGKTVQSEQLEIISTEPPTKTEPKQDPAIEHYSVQLSGNSGAYSKDVELFRGR